MSEQVEEQIDFKLTITEVNIILESLNEMPAKMSRLLINKIHETYNANEALKQKEDGK